LIASHIDEQTAARIYAINEFVRETWLVAAQAIV